MAEFHVEVRKPEPAPPKPKREGCDRRAIAMVGLDAIKMLMRLPEKVFIETTLSDEFDRQNGLVYLVLTGPGLPDDFIVEEGKYPKAAKFACTDNGKQLQDFDCTVLPAEDS